MRAQNYLHRMTVALAVGSLLLGPGVAPFAWAQTAPDTDAKDTPDAVDPPARVGRLAGVVGTVSFHTADQTEWAPATLNYPVVAGESFWTEPQARAEIQVGPAEFRLDESTALDVVALDDGGGLRLLALQLESLWPVADVVAGLRGDDADAGPASRFHIVRRVAHGVTFGRSNWDDLAERVCENIAGGFRVRRVIRRRRRCQKMSDAEQLHIVLDLLLVCG